MKIELKSRVMISGEMKQPGDVVEVEKSVGKNLILRDKAVEAGADAKTSTAKTPAANPTVAPEKMEKLKEIAAKLDVKHNHNIGFPKLDALVREALLPIAEKLEIEAADGKDTETLYNEVVAKVDEQGAE